MKVLIIKTSSLGDILHTLPALTDAASAITDIHFDWVVEEGFAEIPSWHPAVDQVISVGLRRWRKNWFKALYSGEWKAFKQQLKAEKYHCIIDAQGLIKSALLTRYVSAPVHGFDKKSVREPIACHFYSHGHTIAKEQHAVERIRQLFAASLQYNVPASLGKFNLSGTHFSQIPLPQIVAKNSQQPGLVFLHGTTRKNKHWPVDYWCDLVSIAERQGFVIYLPWGNEKEKQRAEFIAGTGSNTFVLPRLNLKNIAAVLSQAQAVVTVDSGLGHLAAALDIPCVSLYGPTCPQLIGTYGANQIHLTCNSAGADCDRKVDPAIFTPLTPESVWSALNGQVLQNPSLLKRIQE